MAIELDDKALVCYQKALELEPKSAWVHANIGNIFNNKGLYSEAKKNLKTSISLFDESEYAVRRMAEVMSNIEQEDSKYKNFVKEGKRVVEARKIIASDE